MSFRHFWGVTKRADLLASLNAPAFEAAYQPAAPTAQNRYSFRPENVSAHYQEWPKVIELCLENSNGLMEKRGGALMDTQKDALEKRMRAYFDAQLNWDDFKSLDYGLIDEQSGFNPQLVRLKAIRAEKFSPERIVRYALRPYDTRWCYYTAVNPIWNRARPSLWAQFWNGNEFFVTRFSSSKDDEGVPFYWSPFLSDDHCLAPDASAFPLRLKKEVPQLDMFSTGQVIRANLSDSARAYLAALGISNPDGLDELENGLKAYELVWLHALAIGYSPAYLRENKDGLQGDWPRIPLPASRAALLASAALGKQIAVLLDTESPLTLTDHLKTIAVLARTDGAQLNPQQGDFAVEAGWGHGQSGIVMPGQGKFVAQGEALDIYLNDLVYWQNIPIKVWEYTIGGYQVIKKWLSYREKKILGRDLTVEEAREVTGMARRIAALIALEARLDENYQQIQVNAYRI